MGSYSKIQRLSDAQSFNLFIITRNSKDISSFNDAIECFLRCIKELADVISVHTKLPIPYL